MESKEECHPSPIAVNSEEPSSNETKIDKYCLICHKFGKDIICHACARFLYDQRMEKKQVSFNASHSCVESQTMSVQEGNKLFQMDLSRLKSALLEAMINVAKEDEARDKYEIEKCKKENEDLKSQILEEEAKLQACSEKFSKLKESSKEESETLETRKRNLIETEKMLQTIKKYKELEETTQQEIKTVKSELLEKKKELKAIKECKEFEETLIKKKIETVTSELLERKKELKAIKESKELEETLKQEIKTVQTELLERKKELKKALERNKNFEETSKQEIKTLKSELLEREQTTKACLDIFSKLDENSKEENETLKRRRKRDLIIEAERMLQKEYNKINENLKKTRETRKSVKLENENLDKTFQKLNELNENAKQEIGNLRSKIREAEKEMLFQKRIIIELQQDKRKNQAHRKLRNRLENKGAVFNAMQQKLKSVTVDPTASINAESYRTTDSPRDKMSSVKDSQFAEVPTTGSNLSSPLPDSSNMLTKKDFFIQNCAAAQNSLRNPSTSKNDTMKGSNIIEDSTKNNSIASGDEEQSNLKRNRKSKGNINRTTESTRNGTKKDKGNRRT